MPCDGSPSIDSAAAPQRGNPADDDCCVSVWCRHPAPGCARLGALAAQPLRKGASKAPGSRYSPSGERYSKGSCSPSMPTAACVTDPVAWSRCSSPCVSCLPSRQAPWPPRGERPEIHLTDTVGDATSLHSLKPKPGKGGGSAGQRRPLLPNSERCASACLCLHLHSHS